MRFPHTTGSLGVETSRALSRPHYLPSRCFYCVKPATVTRGAIRKGLFHASGDRFSSYGSGAREVITRVRFAGSFGSAFSPSSLDDAPPSNSVRRWWATFGWIVVSTIERLGKYCKYVCVCVCIRTLGCSFENRFEIYRWIGFRVVGIGIGSDTIL